MANTQDGGPAFPSSTFGELGMSLRDWFAGQALVGYLAMHADPEIQSLPQPPAIAALVYEIADALIATRAGE